VAYLPWWRLRRLCGITGSALDHSSLPLEFESWHGHFWRVFHLWLCLIIFRGCSAHLAYHVNKSGHKTSIIIIMKTDYRVVLLLFVIYGFCILFISNHFHIYYSLEANICLLLSSNHLWQNFVPWLWDCPTPVLGVPLSSILFVNIDTIEFFVLLLLFIIWYINVYLCVCVFVCVCVCVSWKFYHMQLQILNFQNCGGSPTLLGLLSINLSSMTAD